MTIIAANWKMNGDSKFAAEYRQSLASGKTLHEVIIFPPATLLAALKGGFKLGGQNCHFAEKGAYTGEISAQMLKSSGCEYVLLGHSERREMGETSELVAKKAIAAHAIGLKTIICVGEKDGEDFTKITFDQLKKSIPNCATAENTVIAYEPVWAIGTGKTPTNKEIDERQAKIKTETKFKVLYGGSVNTSNAAEISKLANVDGLLIGGASLDVEGFKKIIASV